MAPRWRQRIRLGIGLISIILDQRKYEKFHYVSRFREVFSRTFPRQCPICRYRGFFLSFGHQNRPEAQCPQCGSLERHRLLCLAITQNGRSMLTGKDVLHFSPERCIRDLAHQTANRYLTADLSTCGQQYDVSDKLDLALDIAEMGLSDCAVDIVICNHVLDQVLDDRAALRELFRVLRPQGAAIISVPIVEGWQHTFEDPNIQSPEDRLKYFGFEDRVRCYGRDFCARLQEVGFATEIFQPQFHTYSDYGLVPGDKIFIGVKP